MSRLQWIIIHGVCLGRLLEPAVVVLLYCLSGWLAVEIIRKAADLFARWQNRKAIKR